MKAICTTCGTAAGVSKAGTLNRHVRDEYTYWRQFCTNDAVGDGAIKYALREVERAANSVDRADWRIALAEAQLGDARTARVAALAALEKARKALAKVSP